MNKIILITNLQKCKTVMVTSSVETYKNQYIPTSARHTIINSSPVATVP